MSLIETAQAILRARDADFATLARIAGLDPQRHFRGADLRNVDFGTDDLTRFDFRDADLSGADLSRARGLRSEMFVGVRFDERTRSQPGLFGPTKPDWAATIDRDGYGMFATILVPALSGKPVMQRLRWIPPGQFVMGSPRQEPGRYADEAPQHRVAIAAGFWLFDTPCTQALWQAVMGRNPSRFKSPTRPVEQVSFEDVAEVPEAAERTRSGPQPVAAVGGAVGIRLPRRYDTTRLMPGRCEILGENNAPVLDAIAWYRRQQQHRVRARQRSMTPAAGRRNSTSAQRAGTHPVGAETPNAVGPARHAGQRVGVVRRPLA